MRLRNITGSKELIAENKYVVHNPTDYKKNWKQVFGNENEIYIEIGMGKGQFITELAKCNPDKNYIGIEKYSSVLLRAIQKMETEEVPNLVFIRMDAEEIMDSFSTEEIAGIYLNFSDPWPKDRHARRRLPSKEFLARYNQILKKDGVVEFKTDNKELFEFALEQVSIADWNLIANSNNLHADTLMSEGNIMTEYEEKFSSKGNPIYKYIINR